MFEEFQRYLPSDQDGQMQAGYIAFCLIVLFVIYWTPNERQREELGDPVPTRRAAQRAAKRKMLRPGLRVPRIFGNLEGPGLGAVVHFLILAGAATAGLIGWRIPAEIERIYGDGAGFGLIFPNVTMPTIGKAAQVIGAVTFTLVALRALRVMIPLMTFALALGLAGLAVEYVFDISLMGELQQTLGNASN